MTKSQLYTSIIPKSDSLITRSYLCTFFMLSHYVCIPLSVYIPEMDLKGRTKHDSGFLKQ